MDWGSARTTTAYNLTVGDIHTYYVLVGDDAALVHNNDTCGWTRRARLRAAGRGRAMIGWLSKDKRHVNVSSLGEVTH